MYSQPAFRSGWTFLALPGGMNRPMKAASSILYYYSGRSFGKDESGYYLLGESEKWYYTSCGNANVGNAAVS